MAEKKLFLLDGHALVYRAHFAFINRPLINSKGINTSAITGFVRTLWDILVNQKPTHIAVAFDPKGPTIRHEYFPEYKANREAQPEDIRIAFPYIEKIVEGFNIPIIKVDTFEADDTIGTIAKQAEKEGFQVFMVTPDKDYAQLVSENINIYKPSRQGNGVEILTHQDILEKWDIANVLQVIDILALQGDSVDNIPGVPGIGPKTAVKLLKTYSDVEGLLSHTHELKGKQKENLETYADQARLSKKLATIILDVPITFDADRYITEPFNRKVLEALFKELEFRTLALQILGSDKKNRVGVQGDLFAGFQSASPAQKKESSYSVAKKNIENIETDYILVDTAQKRNELINLLSKQNEISFDTETTNIDANLAELVGLVFSIKEGQGYYVPIPEDKEQALLICDEFKEMLEDPNITMIGQNIKYDSLIMKWYGVDIKGYYFDTMIAHYLLEPDLRHNLDYLAESYLDYSMISITELIGKKGKNQLTMRDVPVEKVVDYACEDADMTRRLQQKFDKDLKESELRSVYDTIEEPLIEVLTTMEYNGVKIDAENLKNYSKELEKVIVDIQKTIYTEAGVEFNIASPKQVGEVLFDKLKIPYRWKKNASGSYSTDVAKLTELAEKHDIVNKILQFRKYAKLKSTYVDALPNLINPKSGLIHSNFNQARAATGRLSSDNPNLQNIPIRDAAGRAIRKAFVPRSSNHILLAADYSQIELRLIAEISGDESMLSAFIDGNDFHRATAAKVFNVPYDEVSDDQRRMAKTVNFSITYGAGSTNLSRQLGISRKEAGELIDSYFKEFAGLKRYMDETVAYAREHGYVKTLLGRKRTLRDINSKNGMLRSNAERMAINTPIQGTAADMIKLAMIHTYEAMKAKNLDSLLIMQVHDELVFDVVKEELEVMKTLVEECMKNAMPGLKVPILVGMDVGENWLEAH